MEYTGQKAKYRAEDATWNVCLLKVQCTPVIKFVRASLFPYQLVKVYHHTPVYQKALNKRNVWVEPLLAEAKDWHGMRHFACGCSGASIAKLCGSPLVKISNACSKSGAGDATRCQQRRYMPLS
jgi:hypothetical protein